MLIFAGQRVSADLLNELAPLSVIKPGDQHYTNTTLASDNDLVMPVNANASYLVQCYLSYEGGTMNASDMKFEFTVPSGSTLSLGVPAYFFTDGLTHGPGVYVASEVLVVGTQGAGNSRSVFAAGSLIVGNTGGNLQLLAAKNSSGSTDAIIHAQSFLSLQEVT
jgi:hypothetical protein